MRSKAAIARLRAYKPPEFPVWDKLHVSRRAAVLILLYADRRGDLRVVVTMRAASLRSFSGALLSGSALIVLRNGRLWLTRLTQVMRRFRAERQILQKKHLVRC